MFYRESNNLENIQMAFFECSLFSESLGMVSSVNVVLPQKTSGQIGLKGVAGEGGCPVLYLLHGMSDDHSIWLRRTSVERYATQYGLALVMPNAHRSYYTDMACGLKYWTYISEELPRLMHSFFKLSDKREDTFVAGLSMGGFGAFKLAFNCPQKFAAAASLSGALSPLQLLSRIPERAAEFRNIFGDAMAVAGSINDLYAQSELCAKNGVVLPKLFMTCGTSDFLYEENQTFRRHLEKLKIEFTYDEGPGTHEWGYWDQKIQQIIRWLPIRRERI